MTRPRPTPSSRASATRSSRTCPGIFPIIYDVGVWGGLTYFGLFGLFAGFTFRALESGRRIGILLFPTVFVACLEILRIAYLSESRCFLIVVGALGAMSQLRPRPLPV